MDNEVAGEGNMYDYGFRIYDPRIARFLSVDPLTSKFAMLTPYQYASNTPIQAIDLDGLEAVVITESDGSAGHTYLAVVKNGEISAVYSYAGDFKQKPSGTPGGALWSTDGIITVAYGENAKKWIKDRLKHPSNIENTTVGDHTKAYYVDGVDVDAIDKYFDNKIKDGSKFKQGENGEWTIKLSETYELFSNNCTTESDEALRAGGYNVPQQCAPQST